MQLLDKVLADEREVLVFSRIWRKRIALAVRHMGHRIEIIQIVRSRNVAKRLMVSNQENIVF